MMQKEGKTGYIEQYSTQEKGEKKRKTHVDRRPLGHSTLLISASGDRSSVRYRYGTGTLYSRVLGTQAKYIILFFIYLFIFPYLSMLYSL